MDGHVCAMVNEGSKYRPARARGERREDDHNAE